MAEAASRLPILERVASYAAEAHAPRPFVPGESFVPVAGRVYGEEEVVRLVDAALDFWLTAGRFNDEFEAKLRDYLGLRHVLTVNSGSSANLLAVAALTSPLLGGRALRPGDEVITVAAAFPTTVNPLLLYGLVPVFVDVQLPTYNIDPERIEAAVSDRTRAIVLAHTLGNPFDVDAVVEVARRHGLWLIEDCCDALGSEYRGRRAGGFGDLCTLSFYPAHHITTGEGGAVGTNDGLLRRIVESLRDWGRDCHCPPGRDNTCGRRFELQFGSLPHGYDHKYVYSHAGYNLKMTDLQAAVGTVQMDRLPHFVERRRENFRHLRDRLLDVQDVFELPEATPHSLPSWFGFPLTVREGSPFGREQLLLHLEGRRIGTRLLFAGNVTRQPYFQGVAHRVSGDLSRTDAVMNRTFWVGTYPGLTAEMLDYTAETLRAFARAAR